VLGSERMAGGARRVAGCRPGDFARGIVFRFAAGRQREYPPQCHLGSAAVPQLAPRRPSLAAASSRIEADRRSWSSAVTRGGRARRRWASSSQLHGWLPVGLLPACSLHCCIAQSPRGAPACAAAACLRMADGIPSKIELLSSHYETEGGSNAHPILCTCTI
jgi:hypothetical protein